MNHFRTALQKARFWLDRAEQSRDAATVADLSHKAVHNAIAALLGIRASRRLRIHHPQVAREAAGLGLPEALVRQIATVEAAQAAVSYGPTVPTPEMASAFLATARRVVALAETQAKTAHPPGEERRKP